MEHKSNPVAEPGHSVSREMVSVQGPPAVEVGMVDALEGTRSPELAVEAMVGALVEAAEDLSITNIARRKLLRVAMDRIKVLENYLDDEKGDKERQAKVLLKALEIGIRVPEGVSREEGGTITIRVRAGRFQPKT